MYKRKFVLSTVSSLVIINMLSGCSSSMSRDDVSAETALLQEMQIVQEQINERTKKLLRLQQSYTQLTGKEVSEISYLGKGSHLTFSASNPEEDKSVAVVPVSTFTTQDSRITNRLKRFNETVHATEDELPTDYKEVPELPMKGGKVRKSIPNNHHSEPHKNFVKNKSLDSVVMPAFINAAVKKTESNNKKYLKRVSYSKSLNSNESDLIIYERKRVKKHTRKLTKKRKRKQARLKKGTYYDVAFVSNNKTELKALDKYLQLSKIKNRFAVARDDRFIMYLGAFKTKKRAIARRKFIANQTGQTPQIRERIVQ